MLSNKYQMNMFIQVFAVIIDMMHGNKSSLRTVEAQIVQNLKKSKPRPKFTGS